MSRNPHDLLLQWLSGAGPDEDWEAGLHSSAGRAKEAIKAIIFNRITIKVTDSSTPLDKVTLSASSGLLSSALPATASSIETFNSTVPLKLGPAPMTERLKEQVIRTLQDEDMEPNGHSSPQDTGPDGLNGHINGNVNGDVEMKPVIKVEERRSPEVHEIKLELDRDPTLISPEEGETIPPIPAVFRVTDLKREVEAVRDRRKMIRLGPDPNAAGPSTAVLPSVVAFTLFDRGEG